MGYDLEGLAPAEEEGEHFRSDTCWWRVLWCLVCDIADDLADDVDLTGGLLNTGIRVDQDVAREIGRRLHAATVNRDAYEERVMEALRETPGAGLGNRDGVPETDAEAREAGIPFSWENTVRFTDFCMESGGFQIW